MLRDADLVQRLEGDVELVGPHLEAPGVGGDAGDLAFEQPVGGGERQPGGGAAGVVAQPGPPGAGELPGADRLQVADRLGYRRRPQAQVHPRLDDRAGRRVGGISSREDLLQRPVRVAPHDDRRVHDAVHDGARARELCHHGIDQVGHVVGDDEDEDPVGACIGAAAVPGSAPAPSTAVTGCPGTWRRARLRWARTIASASAGSSTCSSGGIRSK